MPQVRPLRDSLTLAAIEYRDRRPLYRALGEILPDADRLPGSWKKLKCLERWWERHVSDGQSDAGRIYVRLDRSARVFDLLVSRKCDQPRDIGWVRQK